MAPRALVLLAEGAEEMETVITVDVLRRGGVEVAALSYRCQRRPSRFFNSASCFLNTSQYYILFTDPKGTGTLPNCFVASPASDVNPDPVGL